MVIVKRATGVRNWGDILLTTLFFYSTQADETFEARILVIYVISMGRSFKID